jgi:hypothetical protein
MNITRFAFFILLAASVCWTGCEMFASHTNPIAGWKLCWSQDPSKLDKAIRDDYQDYINKLSPKERMWIGPIMLSEDGTGQHAVTIEIAWYGTDWDHVLIYDKNNKRVKVVKYIGGHYMSMKPCPNNSLQATAAAPASCDWFYEICLSLCISTSRSAAVPELWTLDLVRIYARRPSREKE